MATGHSPILKSTGFSKTKGVNTMIAKAIRMSVVVLLLTISLLSPSTASAFTHVCFYGPKPYPVWPLDPTLHNNFTVTFAESLIMDNLFMRNTETSGATVIGGELFTFTPSAGLRRVVLFHVPFAAVWKLVGEGWMEGTICGWGGTGCIHLEMPNPQPSLCFAQGVVVPGG